MVTITPDQDYYGSVDVTIAVSDGEYSDSQSFVLTINPVNDAPILIQSFLDIDVLEDSENVLLNLSEYFSDIDNDNLSYSVVSDLGYVNLTIDENSILTIEFLENLFGDGSVEIFASDDQLYISAILNIIVNAVNDAPVSFDLSVETDEDTILEIILEGEDDDQDDLVYSLGQNTSYGDISIVGNVATFTPDLNFNGTTTFTYSVSDGLLTSSISTVTILVNAVNDAPSSTPITTIGDEDTNIIIPLQGNDVDGDQLSYVLVADSENGSVVFDGSIATFTPLHPKN